jgi:hypothetical protein
MVSEIHEELRPIEALPADLLNSTISEVTFKQFLLPWRFDFVRETSPRLLSSDCILVKACACMKGQCRNLERKEDKIIMNCRRAF